VPRRPKADHYATRSCADAERRRNETLIKALVRVHRSRRRIESGQARSVTDLAEQEGVTNAYVCRLLPLTCLAPDIVEARRRCSPPNRWILFDLTEIRSQAVGPDTRGAPSAGE
jgi:hypothetical protein